MTGGKEVLWYQVQLLAGLPPVKLITSRMMEKCAFQVLCFITYASYFFCFLSLFLIFGRERGDERTVKASAAVQHRDAAHASFLDPAALRQSQYRFQFQF